MSASNVPLSPSSPRDLSLLLLFAPFSITKLQISGRLACQQLNKFTTLKTNINTWIFQHSSIFNTFQHVVCSLKNLMSAKGPCVNWPRYISYLAFSYPSNSRVLLCRFHCAILEDNQMWSPRGLHASSHESSCKNEKAKPYKSLFWASLHNKHNASNSERKKN